MLVLNYQRDTLVVKKMNKIQTIKSWIWLLVCLLVAGAFFITAIKNKSASNAQNTANLAQQQENALRVQLLSGCDRGNLLRAQLNTYAGNVSQMRDILVEVVGAGALSTKNKTLAQEFTDYENEAKKLLFLDYALTNCQKAYGNSST